MVNPKPSVFLFIGDDNYSKEKAIDDLSSFLLGGSSKELDYKVFSGADADVREILDYAATIPFAAAKRITVIKDFEKLPQEDKARLIEYIRKPSKTTCLILDAKDDSILQEYDVDSCIDIKRFDGLTDSKLIGWVRGFLAERHKKIEPAAIDTLRELQGQDLLSLAQELEKLTAYTGDREEIKISDVEEVVGKSLVSSVFEITRAIGEKDINYAIEIVSDLTAAGKKQYEIIGIISWHLRNILKAKVLKEKGESDSNIANILRIGRRYTDGFFKQIARFETAQIKSKLEILLEADLNIKRTKYDPGLILEFAMIRLCLGL